MKYCKNIIAALLLMSMTISCNDFLNVLPSTEKESNEMFSTVEGCRSVLIGSYIRMKQNNLYGQELTCGSVENLAQHWTYTSGSIGEYLHKYDYKAEIVETVMNDNYNNLYKVVADVDGLLAGIESHRSILDDRSYNLLRGEALGLRAFCHFDVLRLFGPMPSNLPSTKILPYVKEIKHKPNNFVSYTEYTDQLLQDLNEAESVLAKVDPIREQSIEALNNISSIDDDFWGARQMRMNYYAVCALKARFYLWIGNKEQALKYAKLVMEAKLPDGRKVFRLGMRDDCARGDRTFSSEHIFNLKVNNLSESIGSGRSYQKPQKDLYAQLYEKGTSDIRFVNMWEEVNISYYNRPFYFLKYVQTDKMPSLSTNVIPLIRLSEMYLIAMECSPLAEAENYYKVLCMARDVTPTAINNESDRNKLLIKEYHKEFYGEGQAFYACKRMAIVNNLWTSIPGSVETYVVPLPKKETVYVN